jgi:hypothetical protein
MDEIDREIGDYGLHFCVYLEETNPDEYARLMRRREIVYQEIFPQPLS